MNELVKFNNRKQVTAFAGLDSSIRQSGTSMNVHGRISKKGSKTLRLILVQAAWGLKMHNVHFRQYFNKLKAKGKHYLVCLVALARKILGVIFTLLKYNRTFIQPS